MFSAVLFCQDRVAARTIEQAAQASRDVCIYKTLHVYPSPYELAPLVTSLRPDVVFVDLYDMAEAHVLVRTIRVVCPEAAVIGFSEVCDARLEREAREAGVAEILSPPVTEQRFQQVMQRALNKARPPVQNNLLAFLPAKAGSGSTTVALNLAGCLVQDLEQSVLLVEADLRSGPISILLKFSAEHSIVDALQMASVLDGTLWNRVVVQAQGLDVLPGGRLHEGKLVSWSGYRQLLEFVQSRYDNLVVDLPEVVHDATVEVVRRARHVFIVTTPELPHLVLARQRRQELAERGVPIERVGFVLNRWAKGDVKMEYVEQLPDSRVAAVFPNDYHCVRRAIQEGRLVGRKSELGRAFSLFAARVVGVIPKVRPEASSPVADSVIPG